MTLFLLMKLYPFLFSVLDFLLSYFHSAIIFTSILLYDTRFLLFFHTFFSHFFLHALSSSSSRVQRSSPRPSFQQNKKCFAVKVNSRSRDPERLIKQESAKPSMTSSACVYEATPACWELPDDEKGTGKRATLVILL